MDPKSLEAAATIARESERLRDAASRADLGMLAYLLEQALHEARSVVLSNGGTLTTMAEVIPLKPKGQR